MTNEPSLKDEAKPRLTTVWLFWACLALGLALRCYHYLRDPSMWHDEAALVLNVLGKSFAGLLGPLYFSEAAPPLFLWLEKAVAGTLGDGTYELRLAPFLASVAALLGIAVVARRLLPPAGAVWAVLLFGCSDRLLWHCCEAKPYAVDVLAATGLLLVFTRTSRSSLDRQLLVYAGLAPPLLFLSYPACFLLGGVVLTLLPEVIQARSRRTWLLFGGFLAALGTSFLLLLAGPIHAQRDERILQCWWDMFPSWDRPWTVPGWLFLRLTEVFRYAAEPTGNALAAVAVVGGVGLWRSGQRRLLAFLLWPLALAALAALLGQYPLGATRVCVFTAPAALLLVASGLPVTFSWLRSAGPRLATQGLGYALVVLCLCPVAYAAYRVGWPWLRADSAGAAAFVRAHRRPGEGVIGTIWEHDYYFRDQPARYCPLQPGPGEERGRERDRVWLLSTGHTPQERQGLLKEFRAKGGWAVIGQKEFRLTTVFHLKKK
jgi:hypothetical protein